jgi:predicted small metal-binding protein
MECDCGYVCRGVDVDELVRDAQRHAREAHGIEVSAEQVLALGKFGAG